MQTPVRAILSQVGVTADPGQLGAASQIREVGRQVGLIEDLHLRPTGDGEFRLRAVRIVQDESSDFICEARAGDIQRPVEKVNLLKLLPDADIRKRWSIISRASLKKGSLA